MDVEGGSGGGSSSDVFASSITSGPSTSTSSPNTNFTDGMQTEGHDMDSFKQMRKEIYVEASPCDEEDLTCPVCRKMFKMPYVARCGHTFCFDCLSNICQHSKKCPICAEELRDISTDNVKRHASSLVTRWKLMLAEETGTTPSLPSLSQKCDNTDNNGETRSAIETRAQENPHLASESATALPSVGRAQSVPVTVTRPNKRKEINSGQITRRSFPLTKKSRLALDEELERRKKDRENRRQDAEAERAQRDEERENRRQDAEAERARRDEERKDQRLKLEVQRQAAEAERAQRDEERENRRLKLEHRRMEKDHSYRMARLGTMFAVLLAAIGQWIASGFTYTGMTLIWCVYYAAACFFLVIF